MLSGRLVLGYLWRHRRSSVRVLVIVGVSVYFLPTVTVASLFPQGKEEPSARCEGDEEWYAESDSDADDGAL